MMSVHIPACVTFVMPKGERIRWYSNIVDAVEADGETEINTRDRLAGVLADAVPLAVSVLLLDDGWMGVTDTDDSDE
ncbi:hypothetical protein [Bifidobacterium saguinibicoloris]|uniref:hypothetical protein n=1 Tax=Bifidobacterium saguinibicoloris TaxID=2834433 RepID=UPI001C5A2A86|nr:hypothetical protein [Bifidobacterium saguinibicoloris]MBW3081737.1 hypothetical protein [Bifidobacterium saguinibicoloris]